MRAVKWVGIALAAAFGARIYYVREMIAALVIFSVFFGALAAAVSVIWVIDWLIRRLMPWIEARMARSARWAIASLRKSFAEWDFGRPVEYFRETRSDIQGFSRLSR